MTDKKEYDLSADPFGIGFEAKEEITTADWQKFVKTRRSFLPDERKEQDDPTWWVAGAKAAIIAGLIKVPEMQPNDVLAWSLAKTRWLAEWAIRKYEADSTVPFVN